MASVLDVGGGFSTVTQPRFWFQSLLTGAGFVNTEMLEEMARENLVDLDFRMSSVVYDAAYAIVLLAVAPQRLARPLAVGITANAAVDVAREMGVPNL